MGACERSWRGQSSQTRPTETSVVRRDFQRVEQPTVGVVGVFVYLDAGRLRVDALLGQAYGARRRLVEILEPARGDAGHHRRARAGGVLGREGPDGTPRDVGLDLEP